MTAYLPGAIRVQFGDAPVGAIMPFAGTLDASAVQSGGTENAPPKTPNIEAWGWMMCDGRSLKASEYPELHAVIGNFYGGSGDEFKIPNYLGVFLRGAQFEDASGKPSDPDYKKRQKSKTESSQAQAVGSFQDFALQDHKHGFTVLSTPGEGSPVQAFSPSGSPAETGNVSLSPPASPPVLVSKNETRPINIAVNFIIKFTYGLLPHEG